MRNRFRTKNHTSDEMSLQITSMADIFIIILVFLLKSYSTGAIQVSPSSGLQMPSTETSDPAIEALKIEVSEKSILVEDKPVIALNAFRIASQDRSANQTSPALNQVLNIARQRQELIAKSNPSVKLDSKLLIIADQRTPYATLKTVLASAAVNGFTDYKLVVLKKE